MRRIRRAVRWPRLPNAHRRAPLRAVHRLSPRVAQRRRSRTARTVPKRPAPDRCHSRLERPHRLMPDRAHPSHRRPGAAAARGLQMANAAVTKKALRRTSRCQSGSLSASCMWPRRGTRPRRPPHHRGPTHRALERSDARCRPSRPHSIRCATRCRRRAALERTHREIRGEDPAARGGRRDDARCPLRQRPASTSGSRHAPASSARSVPGLVGVGCVTADAERALSDWTMGSWA